ncbi:hypothetical protein U062_00522 [Gammaproteobacteria bacterium MOLA455]|nr:hypothetical protein U062_00522 [Gammaproteobacteria bacterium MOLA455]
MKNLESWADDEISRLEETFAAQSRSDDMAAATSRLPGSIVGRALGALKRGSFIAGFLLGLVSGLALWALIFLL